jgi:sulfur carrier protein
MQIIINGEPHSLSTSLTITELLQHLDVDAGQVAVEVSGDIIMRSRYDSTYAKEGDTIELVEFVGGG